MSAVKGEVAALLDRLPDDCTLEDVQYHLYVLEKIQRGEDDIKAGRTRTQQETRERLRKWLNE